MAKKRSARMAARKVKDKWRSKQWYTIRAPAIFNEAELGETLADEPEKLQGRVAEATLQDVTGDFSKQHVKCYFRVRGTRGTDAVTTFDGHDLTSDYVRRLVRRSHSKIDDVVDITTADGFQVRIKPMVVTERRVQKSQGTEIRRIARELMEEKAELDYNALAKQLVQGDIAKDLYDRCRLIMPLKRVEIRKSELLGEPEDAVEVLDVFAPPPEPDTGEEEAEAAEAETEETEETDETAEEASEEAEGEQADESSEAEETDEAADEASEETEEEASDEDEEPKASPAQPDESADDIEDREAATEGTEEAIQLEESAQEAVEEQEAAASDEDEEQA